MSTGTKVCIVASQISLKFRKLRMSLIFRNFTALLKFVNFYSEDSKVTDNCGERKNDLDFLACMLFISIVLE